jgi:predicted dehydrogenase
VKLETPFNIALIGTGFRSQTVYRSLFAPLRKRGVQLVAVCDPVRDHADAYAESLGVPAFYSLKDLVRARPMEAAIVCAPVDLHHAISCYLSTNGIHSLVETSMASCLTQAQDMARVARANNVVMRIGDQFFRLPFQRIAQQIERSGFLGPMNRVISTFDHTGFHNNSCWIKFFRAYPEWAQAIEHTMPTVPHTFSTIRQFTSETFHANFFGFPGGRMVCDLTGNVKGLLGRQPRPGYTQFEGQRGVFVWQAAGRWNGPLHQGEGEVRYCSDEALAAGAIADTVYPLVFAQENEFMKSLHVNLPIGKLEYINPFYGPVRKPEDMLDYYHASVAEHVLEFARVIRGEAVSEYTDEDAIMAMTMDVAARESILREGARVKLPLEGRLESEECALAALRQRYGVDPLDPEAMMDVAVPRG